MKRFVIIPLILFIGFWPAMLNADIYTWTDEKGVQHFSNYDPPKHAKLMIKAAQFTTDEKAVQEKIEAKRLERQQLELEEIAQKQALIALKQQAIQEQLDAADRTAEEASKRSKEIYAPGFNGGYDDFRDDSEDLEVNGTPYGYYPPYRYYPHYSYRGHFKHRRSHHFRKRHFGHSGKHHFRSFNRHRFGKFHHGKGRHGFKGSGHHFTRHFRGGHQSRANFRGGTRSRANFGGGHRSRGNFRGGHRGGRR